LAQVGRKRVAALISGRGSNLQALIDAATDPAYPAEIALVLSNIADAAGLDRARQVGIATLVIGHKGKTREAFDAEVDAVLKAHGIELICLAGFMRLFTSGFVERWADRIINIHPSLLPAFPGLDTHRRVIEAGVLVTGCTVHLVRPEVDSGPVIAQALVRVHQGDTADALGRRVLAMEHRIYPTALELMAAGRLEVVGEKVIAADEDAEAARLALAPDLEA
jgi:phosphoribosylglycinamide formyltransferase-1